MAIFFHATSGVMNPGYPSLCNPKSVWVAGGEERGRGVRARQLLPKQWLYICSFHLQSWATAKAQTCHDQPTIWPTKPASLPHSSPCTIHHSASSSLRRAKEQRREREREEKSPISVEWFSPPHRVCPGFSYCVCFPVKVTGLRTLPFQVSLFLVLSTRLKCLPSSYAEVALAYDLS